MWIHFKGLIYFRVFETHTGCLANECWNDTGIINAEVNVCDDFNKTWYIGVPVGQRVSLAFLTFDLDLDVGYTKHTTSCK